MATHGPGSSDPLSLRGVVPPIVTAFEADETVDHETTAAHARFVVEGGVHGVFPLGTNGEFALLTPEERRGVVETVVEEVEGDVPVIAGVGAPSTHETIDHARHAEGVGVDGIVVITPYYYPLDHVGTVEHYRRVADAVSIPIYVYHIPGRTGNALSGETLATLAEIDGVAGCKDSSKDVPWLVGAIDAHPELTFLSGSDSLLFAGFEIGCSGAVSAVANAFPELVVELFEAYDDGDERRASELQSQVLSVREGFKAGGSYMAGVKSALRLRGFDAGPLRTPLRLMNDEEIEALRDALSGLEALEEIDVTHDG